MPRSLSKDLSRDELFKMRENGMTNQDIADVLGVSYSTIHRIIGRQPAALRKPYGSGSVAADYPSCAADSNGSTEETYDVSLVVEDRRIKLAGLFASYYINVKDKSCDVVIEDGSIAMSIPLGDLSVFIQELSAIDRHSDQLKVGVEAW